MLSSSFRDIWRFSSARDHCCLHDRSSAVGMWEAVGVYHHRGTASRARLGPSRGRRDVTPLNTPLLPTSEANTAEKAQKLAAVQRGAVQKPIKLSPKAAVSTGVWPKAGKGSLSPPQLSHSGPSIPTTTPSSLCCPAASSERQHRARIEGQAARRQR